MRCRGDGRSIACAVHARMRARCMQSRITTSTSEYLSKVYLSLQACAWLFSPLHLSIQRPYLSVKCPRVAYNNCSNNICRMCISMSISVDASIRICIRKSTTNLSSRKVRYQTCWAQTSKVKQPQTSSSRTATNTCAFSSWRTKRKISLLDLVLKASPNVPSPIQWLLPLFVSPEFAIRWVGLEEMMFVGLNLLASCELL